MNTILNIIKKAFLWSYARNTWQWDVLCVLILIFIFMTPKSWFANGELPRRLAHQTATVSTVIIGAEVVDNERIKGNCSSGSEPFPDSPTRKLSGTSGPGRTARVR